MGSFSLNASIEVGFTDAVANARTVSLPGDGRPRSIVTDFTSFTADANDPTIIFDWTGDGTSSYSGWLKLVVASTVRVRIEALAGGINDTLLFLFDESPTSSSEPIHLGDDNFPGGTGNFRSSLHDVGTNANGTKYPSGSAGSDDLVGSGLVLAAGTYWLLLIPYDAGDWDTNERWGRVLIEEISQATLDAYIVVTRRAVWTTYTFDANIDGWTGAAWTGYSNAAAVSWQSGDGHDAAGALDIVFTNSSSDQSVLGTIDGVLVGGRQYTLTFWVKSVTGSGNIQWAFGSRTDSSAGRRATTIFNQAITTSFVQKTLSFTPTVTVTDPVVWIASYGAISKTIRVDDVRITSNGQILDAVKKRNQTGSKTLDAFFDLHHFSANAVIKKTGTGSFGIDANTMGVITLPSVGTGSGLLDAVIVAAPSFTADALLVGTFFYLNAVVRRLYPSNLFPANAIRKKTLPFTFRVDAVKARRTFTLNAVKGTLIHPTSSFTVDAWSAIPVAGRTGSFTVDAYVDSYWSETTFAIDAVVIGATRTGSTTLQADISRAGEVRGSTSLLAAIERPYADIFKLYAWVGDPPAPVETTGSTTVDALLLAPAPQTFTLDAVKGKAPYTIDAVVIAGRSGGFSSDAIVASLTGNIRQFVLDATKKRTMTGSMALLAHIVGTRTRTFTLNAMKGGRITLDAFIRPTFTLNAYIGSDQLVVYPPSQEGTDGQMGSLFSAASGAFTEAMEGSSVVIGGNAYLILHVVSGTTLVVAGTVPAGTGQTWSIPSFGQSGSDGVTTQSGQVLYSPTGEFDPTLAGGEVVIGGEGFPIVTVPDGQTVVIGGAPPTGSGIDWGIPSGSAVDPGGAPILVPLTRKTRVDILWSRPEANVWHVLTPDVMWAQTSFTQSARVGAGEITITLLGSFSEFTGGEEVILEFEGRRVVGGYVIRVERTYVFVDDETVPATILHGVDYNILFDRLVVFNAEWDEDHGGSGKYRNWTSFARDTSDQEIIQTVARRYISDIRGMNVTNYVDEIESPAPTTRWTMEPGSPFRTVMTEISRITEGVWYLDAYKDLHYHARGVVTAPYPITDGDGGISCRALTMETSLDVVANDVLVWGTAGYVDRAQGEIMFSHQIADADWDEEFWTFKIERAQDDIARIQQTPPAQRTVKQKTELAALKRSVAVWQQKLAASRGGTGSVETYGRWQYAEYRQDIIEQAMVNRRARAVMKRYSQPVSKASAVVFEPGFAAGQVVSVSSAAHRFADELVIREMRVDFVTGKEPDGNLYYAVPRYTLSMGLDPEEPWDIYQYLPFPDFKIRAPHFHMPTGIGILFPDFPPIGGSDPGPIYLDTFSRTQDDDQLGRADSERDEDRYWFNDEGGG